MNVALKLGLIGMLALFSQNSSVSAQTGPETSSAAAPFTLHGGVEHSEKLPPVEKQFRHGARIDASVMQSTTLNNRWYRLPEWAAGTWTSVKSTKTYMRDLESGREQTTPLTKSTKMEFSWGFQQDKTGRVWEFAKEPYSLTVDTSDKRVIKRVLKRDFRVSEDDAKITLKTITENVVVDKFNNVVVRTVQSENIQSCAPSPNSCMTCNASYKLFDERGKAIELGNEVNISRKLSDFKSIDQYEGKNMPNLFREFLTEQGKADLLN